MTFLLVLATLHIDPLARALMTVFTAIVFVVFDLFCPEVDRTGIVRFECGVQLLVGALHFAQG